MKQLADLGYYSRAFLEWLRETTEALVSSYNPPTPRVTMNEVLPTSPHKRCVISFIAKFQG